jgi:D-alanyl-D-alanine carboxypeptidase
MPNLNELLQQTCQKYAKKLHNLQVEIHHAKLERPLIFSSTKPGQKFHSASVGKIMTAVVIIRLIEDKKLAWDSKVSDILDADTLKGLFVFQGSDHVREVTVEQLLGHTSGINDYFEGITTQKKSFIDEAIQNRDKFYTPAEMLDYTRKHQTAVGKPGEKFLYSDSGYLLLGLIGEKLYGKPFYQILQETIFLPLGMADTGLMFYDSRVNPKELAPVIVKNIDMTLAESLSIDFSGGGLSTTTQDLSLFLRALYDHRLVSAASLERMSRFKYPFETGMFYGLGLMEVRFEKFFFLLKGLPRLSGHLGVLGVHAWFDSQTGDTYVINVGNMGKMVDSFRLLIEIAALLNRPERVKKLEGFR